MTVIAAFNVQGCPMLFGDLLVSGPTGATPERVVGVPALGDVRDFFGESGWSILGLHQKIAIISENCAIAWAGTWWVARVAITGLRELLASRQLTADEILAFLHEEPDVQRHPDMAFVGWVTEGSGLRQFRYQAVAFDGGPLGTVYAAGSGVHAISELATALGADAPRVTNGAPSTGAIAVSTSLAMGGLLLRSEFHSGDAAPTLRALFGGGYEVAWFNGREFQKVPAVTFVIWQADVAAQGDVRLTVPQLILKQQYAGDILLMRSARLAPDGPARPPRVVDEQSHVVLPMYETSTRVSRDDLLNMSLQSELLCHCFLVSSGEELVGVYTRIQQTGPNSELMMTFGFSEGALVVGLNQTFIAGVVDSLRAGVVARPKPTAS